MKRPSANASELMPEDFTIWVPILLQKLHRYAPRVACFHGLTAYRPFCNIALKSPGATARFRPAAGAHRGYAPFCGAEPQPR